MRIRIQIRLLNYYLLRSDQGSFERKNLKKNFKYVFFLLIIIWIQYTQMVKVFSTKKKHNYSLGAKGNLFYWRKNTRKIPYTDILLAVVDQVHGSGSASRSALRFLPGSVTEKRTLVKCLKKADGEKVAGIKLVWVSPFIHVSQNYRYWKSISPHRAENCLTVLEK